MIFEARINKLKYAWSQLPLRMKILFVAMVLVFTTVVSVYGSLALGGLFGGGDEPPPTGRSNVTIDTRGVERGAIDDSVSDEQVAARREVERREFSEAAADGGSYLPNFDLRSETIADAPITDSENNDSQKHSSERVSYTELLNKREAEKLKPVETEKALPKKNDIARTTTDIIPDRNSNSKNSTSSDEAVEKYIQQRAVRLSAAYSKSIKSNSTFSDSTSSGSFILSEDVAPKRSELASRPGNQISSGDSESGALNMDGSAKCALCPGDLITARITKDIDSRYSTNVEFEIVDGALAGSPVFGKFQIVNEGAVMKKDVRIVLSTTNWLYESGTSRFPGTMKGFVVDLRTGSELIDQDVKTRSGLKWLAWASTSLMNTWATRKIANATVTKTTDTSQTQSSTLSESDVWAVSGGLLLGQLSDIAAAWMTELPQITIPKNEVVSIMIVDPINETWMPDLKKGEDFY